MSFLHPQWPPILAPRVGPSDRASSERQTSDAGAQDVNSHSQGRKGSSGNTKTDLGRSPDRHSQEHVQGNSGGSIYSDHGNDEWNEIENEERSRKLDFTSRTSRSYKKSNSNEEGETHVKSYDKSHSSRLSVTHTNFPGFQDYADQAWHIHCAIVVTLSDSAQSVAHHLVVDVMGNEARSEACWLWAAREQRVKPCGSYSLYCLLSKTHERIESLGHLERPLVYTGWFVASQYLLVHLAEELALHQAYQNLHVAAALNLDETSALALCYWGNDHEETEDYQWLLTAPNMQHESTSKNDTAQRALSIVKILLEIGVSGNISSPYLHGSVARLSLTRLAGMGVLTEKEICDVLDLLAEHGLEVKQPGTDHDSLLVHAAEDGLLTVMNWLLDHGARGNRDRAHAWWIWPMQ